MVNPQTNSLRYHRLSISKRVSGKVSTLTHTEVAAIILAAGRSRRMGAFKPLLPFGPATVIESCVSYLRGGGVKSIIVVVGHRSDDIRKHLENSDVLIIENPDYFGEMTSSIAVGLSQLPLASEAVMITPADLPAVTPEIVTRIIAEWRNGHRLVKPTWNDQGGHPILVDLSFRNELENLDPARGLKALFDDHLDQVKRLPVDSNYIARDLDTWDDYAALHYQVFGKLPPVLSDSESPAGRLETN